MSFEAWLELLASGLITGGIYALVALGLNLQYGLMRILNIAHGEFLMLGAYLTWMAQSTLGGDDLLLGDGGADSIHAGAGRDVVNAGAADDTVFGGDGADALWGGVGHDRVFGGEGNDLLDVKRRGGHSALWRAAAPLQDTDGLRRTTNGKDLLYGGSGADGLQADEGDSGRSRTGQGDRLIDWNGKANAFKVCRTGRGSGKVLDESSSSMVKTLRELAKSSGAVGSAELAIPMNERTNRYPGRPGFVCER